MKFFRITAAVLALLMLTACSCLAGGQEYLTITTSKIGVGKDTGRLVVYDDDAQGWMLMAADGSVLSSALFEKIDFMEKMFEITALGAADVNCKGLMDADGNIVLPMQYAEVRVLSEKWQLGSHAVKSTAEKYDYSFGADGYVAEYYDVYFGGQLVGRLSRFEGQHSTAYGDYLYVRQENSFFAFYDSSFEPSSYQSSMIRASEYEEKDGAVWHCGSGQRAFEAGCTLKSGEVVGELYQKNGSVVDLQGNVLFQIDAKYDSASDFVSGYACVQAGGKYGLIDRTGREILACEYDDINWDDFAENMVYGCLPVIRDGKFGYVNLDGEVTCEFKYSADEVYTTDLCPFNFCVNPDTKDTIVLTGGAGELPWVVRQGRWNGKLCALLDADGNMGLVNMYGEMLIPLDGTYDSSNGAGMAVDGSMAVIAAGNNEYHVYRFDGKNQPAAEQGTEEKSEDGWKCVCGTVNSGKFCTGCGSPKPTPEPVRTPAPAAGEWTCSCGGVNGGRFCTECGAAKPEDDGSWTCSCGSANKGKFCTECGTAKPADQLICKKCGFEPEGTPKFCTECGSAF